MTKILLKANGASLSANAIGKITSGMVGVPVEIEYNNEWDNLSKTAFFRVGNQVRKKTGINQNTTVPWEILRNHSKRLEIGIEGRNTNGDIVIPTIWATVCTVSEGASGEILAAPLPSNEIAQGGGSIDDSIISYEHTWSSKNTVDKLCPSFTESGPAVTCDPVEGYPLTVQTDGASKIYRSGKNLIVFTPGTTTINGVTFDFYEDGTIVLNGTATGNFAYTAFSEDIPIRAGLTYTLSGCTGGSPSTYMLYVEESKIIKAYAANAPATAVSSGSGFVKAKIVIYGGTTVSNLVIKPQLEIGSSATAFELGRETEEFTPGEAIPALAGVNTIWADTGDVTVTGKADPVAVNRKQDERIKALEASLTALLEG